MEELDLYDDNGNKLDETIIRGEKTALGKNIMLSVAFIKDANGDFLIQKTSQEKGGNYSSTGGHVSHGENGDMTIIRELKEELGIVVKDDQLHFIAQFKYPTKNCIFNVYQLIVNNIEVNNIELQESEVESISLMSESEILQIINNGNFLESHAYIFENYIINNN